MSDLYLDYDKIQEAANEVGAMKVAIEQSLARAQTRVDSLTAAGFQTQTSSSAFDDKFTQFVVGTCNAIASLEGIKLFLDELVATHTEADGALAVALNGTGASGGNN